MSAANPRTCADCGTTLGYRNTSGYCGRHVWRFNMQQPGWREKMRRGVLLRLAHDPELRESFAKRLRAVQSSPQAKAARKARWERERPWEKGNAAQPAGSEPRRRAAAAISARRLAHIPPHLRDEYRHLTAVKRFSAAEAEAMIAELHEVEMRRWRQSIGASA